MNTVARGDADFGINFVGADEPGIDFEPILHERFVMACRFDHPLAKRRSVSWDDIGKHPYMTVAKSSGNRMVLDRARAPGEKQLASMVEVRHVSTLLEMVRAGLGIAVVPQLAMPTGSESVLRSVAMKGGHHAHIGRDPARRAGAVAGRAAFLRHAQGCRPALIASACTGSGLIFGHFVFLKCSNVRPDPSFLVAGKMKDCGPNQPANAGVRSDIRTFEKPNVRISDLTPPDCR